MPTSPRATPRKTIATPLTGELPDMVDAASSPRRISVKYSAGPKSSACSAMTGAKNIMIRMPTLAPMKL